MAGANPVRPDELQLPTGDPEHTMLPGAAPEIAGGIQILAGSSPAVPETQILTGAAPETENCSGAPQPGN